MSEREQERGDEHKVTPLELFFDLTFVFAITQVTSLLADDPTWGGVLRGNGVGVRSRVYECARLIDDFSLVSGSVRRRQ